MINSNICLVLCQIDHEQSKTEKGSLGQCLKGYIKDYLNMVNNKYLKNPTNVLLHCQVQGALKGKKII